MPQIPKDHTLYAVWPSEEGTDCTCPLCDDGYCVLNNCGCYDSTFGPKIRNVSANNFTLCWPNLLADRNNSHIYFFFEAQDNQPNNMLLFRIYDSVYNLVVRSELVLLIIMYY